MTTLSLQHTTIQQQVADHFREQIREGRLACGDRLPTRSALGKQLGVSASTIHWAFQQLIAEGLLVARASRGTFVADQLPGLRRIAIYYPENALTNADAHFLRALHDCLLTKIAGGGLEARFFHDYRSPSEVPMEELEHAVVHHKVDGIIAPALTAKALRGLRKLDAPLAVMTTANLPNAVKFDYAQFMKLSLDHLQAHGCRSVGLLSPMPVRMPLEPEYDFAKQTAFTRHFIEETSDRGLEVRDCWLLEPPEKSPSRLVQNQYGYDRMHELLAMKDRPDGLIVFPDTVSTGVVMAMLEADPGQRDMKLVIHKHEEIPLLCPVPAMAIVSRVSDASNALIQMLEDQFSHAVQPEPQLLTFSLAKLV